MVVVDPLKFDNIWAVTAEVLLLLLFLLLLLMLSFFFLFMSLLLIPEKSDQYQLRYWLLCIPGGW